MVLADNLHCSEPEANAIVDIVLHVMSKRRKWL